MKAILRYLGGKNIMSKWIISHFPEHRVYVEPFGGSGAVLINKEPCSVEVYNDIYGRLVNFWRVLRNNGEELASLLELTPYAQEEYKSSLEISDDPIEDARRFAIISMMGYGGGGKGKEGFRRGGPNRHTSCPKSWLLYPETIRECAISLRDRNIEISKKDAISLMQSYDGIDTLHYVDPPYLQHTRGKNTKYCHEYLNEDHEKLIDYLLSVKGKVVLSGYDNELYSSKLSDWRTDKRECRTTQNKDRCELLWMNF